MKIALVFLAFFVGASYQQYQAFYQSPYGAGAFYQPMFAVNPYPYAVPSPVAPVNKARSESGALPEAEVEAAHVDAQARGGSVYFSIPGFGLLSTTSTKIVTTYSTLTSTATTIAVTTCIPSTYFSSSTACRRRRAIFEDSGILADHIAQTDAEPVPEIFMPPVETRVESEPEIMSSQEEVEAPVEHSIKKRYVTTVTTTTTTSTVTSYSFSSSTYTKTLKIGSTTSVLLCLPAGYTKC